VSDKFDVFRNWAVVGELMSLPVAIISSLQLSSPLLTLVFVSVTRQLTMH